MNRREFLPLSLPLLAMGSPRLERFSFEHENVLGTSLECKIAAIGESDARRAERAALAEIDRLNRVLSAFDAQSEFRRWLRTQGEAVPVSPELFEVLAQFDAWRARTGGALDAAAETVSRVWKQAAREQRRPAEDTLRAAVAAAQGTHWKLDAERRTATHLSDAALVLHSFAKSYVAERAAQAALASGAAGVALNLGGDLVVRGAWQENVRVADPRADGENGPALAHFAVADRAVATSGGYRRNVALAGESISHLVDPRNGQPAREILSATVSARDAVTAGAWATALAVVPLAEALELVKTVAGDVDYLLLDAGGRRVASPRWAAFAAQGTTAATSEVVVQFELARIEDGRYRRPFVAVWIEDKDKFPLRTVALWFDKPRWLPDLKSWYRGDRMRAMAEGKDITSSVSSATRPPGKYTVRWDGKDQQGQLVKPGKYSVCLEVAREHGTYQVIRQEIDWGGPAKQFTFPANTEIASAAIDYRKH